MSAFELQNDSLGGLWDTPESRAHHFVFTVDTEDGQADKIVYAYVFRTQFMYITWYIVPYDTKSQTVRQSISPWYSLHRSYEKKSTCNFVVLCFHSALSLTRTVRIGNL